MTKKETEKKIEQRLVAKVKELNGLCYKFTSPAHAGVPDRICVFPTGELYFVECKAPYGRLSKLQQLEVQALKNRRCNVLVVYSESDVDNFIERMRNIIAINREAEAKGWMAK